MPVTRFLFTHCVNGGRGIRIHGSHSLSKFPIDFAILFLQGNSQRENILLAQVVKRFCHTVTMVNDAPDLHPNDLNAATIAFAVSGVSRPSFLLGYRLFLFWTKGLLK